MKSPASSDILEHIEVALQAATTVLAAFVPGRIETKYKADNDPVTEADRAVNQVLRDILPRDGDGWLSEESADDLARLGRERVWVVDPLDGTIEFVAGIPEWCVSVGLVENGTAIAGGICNPATGEIFLGSLCAGVFYNGRVVRVSTRCSLAGATVLASRSEVNRGEWQRFGQEAFRTRPIGSVAYKLALVSAGLADATWTLCPKHEWDVAAGAALVHAGGGVIHTGANSSLKFNNEFPLLPDLCACGANLWEELANLLGDRRVGTFHLGRGNSMFPSRARATAQMRGIMDSEVA